MAEIENVNLEEAQIHTEELQDIIAAPPSWLIRWGIGIFLCVILAVFTASSLVQYPDTIKIPLMVSSNNAPKDVVAIADGRLADILVNPGQIVKKGQDIAYLDNDADANTNHQQVLMLLTNLLTVKNDLFSTRPIPEDIFKHIDINSLGNNLQSAYESFYLAYMANRIYIKNRDWEKLPDFIYDLNKLTVDVQEWKKKHVLMAAKNGHIYFTQPLTPDQPVKAGQKLFYIASGANQYFGETMVPQAEMSKIKIGQKVIIKVNHLPFEKYGVIEGKVAQISELPLNNGNYVLNISFLHSDKGLIHSPNLRAGMDASAEIITQNITLFNRITSGLFNKAMKKL